MEIVSRLNQTKRHHCDIEVYPYLRDHHLEGGVILPAVEEMIVLAGAVKTHYPQIDINCMQGATFPRFLSIPPDTTRLPVMIDMKESGDGGIRASLITTVTSKTGDIRRTVEHASVEFLFADNAASLPPPFPIMKNLEGGCISVPSEAIYRELVPFGEAYQNIMGDLSVLPDGAHAFVSGGDHEADESLLGSPFPLDATLHAACVWGQRFAGMVSFPVGFGKRVIYQKTIKGNKYLGRVVPAGVSGELLIFNAWIYDLNDVICESISGMEMRDVSRGRLSPPEWIRA
ncbi:MAG TPA: polyketide synthase dehydratase domain-containing protein [Smithella sp.]|nr:polyketide synthase dehydratase domain-containing protein [Smithella sp.]